MTLGRAVLAISVAAGSTSGACLAEPKRSAGEGPAPAKGDAAEGPAPPEAGARRGSRREARRAAVRFPKGRIILAEIADTPEHWARGYMFRREVGKDEGMVFLFPEPGFHPFWMKNTLVPLDIIWMDDSRTIVHIESGTPPCKADPCPSYGPLRLVSSVLEVRAGTTAAEGLKVGDRLSITFPQSGD